MAIQLRAVEVERAIATLSRCDPRLELGQPARCHLREGEPRRDRQLAHASEALEEFALNAHLRKRFGIDGAETRPPLDHHADCVPSILLPVDPTLEAHASATTAARHAGSSVRRLGSRRITRERAGAQLLERNDDKLNSASMNRSRSTRSGAG